MSQFFDRKYLLALLFVIHTISFCAFAGGNSHRESPGEVGMSQYMNEPLQSVRLSKIVSEPELFPFKIYFRFKYLPLTRDPVRLEEYQDYLLFVLNDLQSLKRSRIQFKAFTYEQRPLQLNELMVMLLGMGSSDDKIEMAIRFMPTIAEYGNWQTYLTLERLIAPHQGTLVPPEIFSLRRTLKQIEQRMGKPTNLYRCKALLARTYNGIKDTIGLDLPSLSWLNEQKAKLPK